jgi:type I restriction enzyme M protein
LPENQKSYSKTKQIQLAEFDSLMKWWHQREESDQSWQVSIETLANNDYKLDIKNPNKIEEKENLTSNEILDLLHSSFQKSDQLLDHLRKELI